MSRGRAALGLVLLLAGCGAPGAGDEAPTATAAASSAAESVTLLATGDVLVHQDGALVAGAATGDGGYDFTDVFAPVAPLIAAADLALCHLETPVAPEAGPFRGYPGFAVQPQVVDALADAGYDLCTTASNHSLDDGVDGLDRTLDVLDAAGIASAGTYRSAAESTTPVVVDAAGVRVASVAATSGLNGVPLPAGRPWAVDVADVPDVDGVLAAAARARAAGAEIVVASLHCCREYEHEPTAAQEEAVRTLLASPDVDLVLGHHAHVVQPFERIDGEWAAYGLGNHLAEHATRGFPTEDSVAARFTFTRGADGRFAVSRAEAVPLRIDRRPDRVQVAPADPATAARVAEVLDRRGAVAAGLAIVPG
ncbi:CapA family protein [Geodermatophilus sabuli]|uniref:Poly-gamma-glutamate synthesis protein (Capsule biosynthesis protein) n=1 Tax=Geodermatophilus sabuli TaxID=1564158 RepID=A0A285E811_9ACTN|nr:CapA family protein [Geodermatophilus sabuli]MBB3081973.1 poly-gamma-glutamate synthesis protein (capsule biosynthesis protein) [Geodermatophilus sabuli]SNX95155.1 poly-gamma-glutamate synthesis protein (capsule biosynthesis protein) [Geodermatophilus sabuli]